MQGEETADAKALRSDVLGVLENPKEGQKVQSEGRQGEEDEVRETS